MSDYIQPTDGDLSKLASDSAERAPARLKMPPLASCTMADVLRAADRARAAQEAAGIVPEPESQARARQLRPVLDLLPAVIRSASREELAARMHPRLQVAVEAWSWGSGNLVLSGRTRAGKSTAAGYLVRLLCHRGARHGGEAFELAKSIRWQECRELSEVAREHRLGGGEAPELIMCKHARLLILDDLGGADDRTTLERILQFRINRAWPTIITTGLRADGSDVLEKLFGEALSARLFECGALKGKLVEVFDV